MAVEEGDLDTNSQYLRDIKAALGDGDLAADLAQIKADIAAIRAILES